MNQMKQDGQDNTAPPPDRRQLRREMIARRAALDPATHAAHSAAIAARLLAALPPPRCVAFCWPIKHEPDVRAAVAAWRAAGSRIALPVVVAEAAPLAFREWAEDGELAPDRYGIPTPVSGDWLAPDLILLPLNGFDAAGYRLGYGGGFFDRTLAALQPRPVAVGVGFECNRLTSIAPEAHDQRLDWLVSEAGVWRIEG
ncbi:5-formyltetrahydrofolate cyclo-ligase [Dechloromonas sp. ZY10]|uniref:5-formyltetrahydrofolate cyclo-ligase n=1 Tax=Dechloromonas aquae TaxID=2664436 RepID=UPI0035299D2D